MGFAALSSWGLRTFGRVTTGALANAVGRVLSPALLAALPLYLGYGVYLAFHQHAVGLDFRGELYPEAKLVLHGANPFPAPHSDLSGGVNRIWPIPAALLVAPLTLLPAADASVVCCLLLALALVASLRVLGIADWRVYALVALWPATFTAVQSGNLSIVLALLVAVAWRLRNRRLAPGVAIGLAVALKLFLWPVGIWLLARRRFASTALAAALAVGGSLLVLPFTSLTAYEQLMRNLGDTFGPQSYDLIGLLTRSDLASTETAGIVARGVGLLVLALAYRRRSPPLAVGAALVSPIVWSHYFVLLMIPLALSSRRLSIAWALPLVLCLSPADGHEVRAWNIAIVLAAAALVTLVGELSRRDGLSARLPVSVEPAAGG